jgi:RimJ/RimL family protein N-acetyltransferase
MKHAHAPYVHGAVRLRLLAEDDLRSTLDWRNRDGVRQQFKSSAPLAWDAHHGWFFKYSEKPDDLVFIVEDVASGERVGQVAIYAIDNVKRTAEIGRFVASPEFQGKGMMRQGIEALMHFAASELSLMSVYLEVIETNERARRLYRGLGLIEQKAADGLVRMERAI